MAGPTVGCQARRDFLADDGYPTMPSSMGDSDDVQHESDAGSFTPDDDPDDDELMSSFSPTSSLLADDQSHLDIDDGFPTETTTRSVVALRTPLPELVPVSATSMGATQSPAALAAAWKPARNPVQGPDGLYRCQFPGCHIKPCFARKCEWNKHMDKHERPYVCLERGCETLIGFTYSGGLVRHEREVHGKHGGPKNKVNCPHKYCKRNAGKGFSRQENLVEHLRRVHSERASGHDDSTSSASGFSPAPDDADARTCKSRNKRKRETSDDDHEDEDARRQIRRLEMENTKLVEQMETLIHEHKDVKTQLATLQQILHNQVAQQAAQQAIQLSDPTPDAVQEQRML